MHILSGIDYYDRLEVQQGGDEMANSKDVGIKEEDLQVVNDKLSQVPKEFQDAIGEVENSEEPHPSMSQHCYGD